jgi:hypothetical protein
LKIRPASVADAQGLYFRVWDKRILCFEDITNERFAAKECEAPATHAPGVFEFVYERGHRQI